MLAEVTTTVWWHIFWTALYYTCHICMKHLPETAWRRDIRCRISVLVCHRRNGGGAAAAEEGNDMHQNYLRRLWMFMAGWASWRAAAAAHPGDCHATKHHSQRSSRVAVIQSLPLRLSPQHQMRPLTYDHQQQQQHDIHV